VIQDIGDCGAALASRVAGCEGVGVNGVLGDLTRFVDAEGDEVGGSYFETRDVGCGAAGPPFAVAVAVDCFIDVGSEILPLRDVLFCAIAPSRLSIVCGLVTEFVVADLVFLVGV